MIFFHVTPTSRVSKILKEGLRPNKSPVGLSLSNFTLPDARGVIYLVSSLSSALDFALDLEDQMGFHRVEIPELAILMVNTLQQTFEDLETDPELGALYVLNPIPAQNIRLVATDVVNQGLPGIRFSQGGTREEIERDLAAHERILKQVARLGE